jgi:hypothetical protein
METDFGSCGSCSDFEEEMLVTKKCGKDFDQQGLRKRKR